MRNLLIHFVMDEDGQATEYMLAISVLVIAVVAATIVFMDPLESGMTNWGDGYSKAYGDPNGLPKP